MHFLELPIELRVRVFEYVLRDLSVRAEHGPPMTRPVRKPGVREKFGLTPDSDDSDGWQLEDPPPPLYQITIPALYFVNRQISSELRTLQWLSLVEFIFPSTLALLDVLLTLPLDRLALVRKVVVDNYPVPLWPVSDEHAYKVHDIFEVWTLLGGIQLDSLRVNDVSRPDEGPSSQYMTLRSMDNMISTQGWKQLTYWSFPLLFPQAQMNAFRGRIHRLRHTRNESDLEIEFPTTDLTASEDGRSKLQELQKDPGNTCAQIVVKRGSKANTWQERSFSTNVLKGLFEHMTWKEMRLSGDYLWVESTEVPGSHD